MLSKAEIRDLLPDEEWTALLDLQPQERERRMAERYRTLASVNPAVQEAAVASMVLAEYALPENDLRQFGLSRVRAWLGLDPDSSIAVIRAHEAVLAKVSANIAMRRVAMRESISRELTTAEQAALRALAARLATPRVALAEDSRPAKAPSFWERFIRKPTIQAPAVKLDGPRLERPTFNWL